MTALPVMKSSIVASYRYAEPFPASNSRNAPSGLAAMLCGPGIDRTAPNTVVLSTRGCTVLPTTFHSVPSDINTCGPRFVVAMICGESTARDALNQRGGYATLPLTALRFKSTILIDSPP